MPSHFVCGCSLPETGFFFRGQMMRSKYQGTTRSSKDDEEEEGGEFTKHDHTKNLLTPMPTKLRRAGEYLDIHIKGTGWAAQVNIVMR